MVWFFFLDGKDGKEKNNDNNAPHSPEENKRCICQKLRRFSVLDLGPRPSSRQSLHPKNLTRALATPRARLVGTPARGAPIPVPI